MRHAELDEAVEQEDVLWAHNAEMERHSAFDQTSRKELCAGYLAHDSPSIRRWVSGAWLDGLESPVARLSGKVELAGQLQGQLPGAVDEVVVGERVAQAIGDTAQLEGRDRAFA